MEKSLAETGPDIPVDRPQPTPDKPGTSIDALPEGFGEATLTIRKLRESVEKKLSGISLS